MIRSFLRSFVLLMLAGIMLATQPGVGSAAGRTIDHRIDPDDIEGSITLVAKSVDAVYTEILGPIGYESPEVEIVAGVVDSDCGPARAGEESFFCPSDHTIYFDLPSLSETFDDHGATALVYAVAREYGHYLHLLDFPADTAAGRDPADPRQLVADCWAGMFMFMAEQGELVTPGVGTPTVVYLLETTKLSAETDDPGSLRVERFLSGYYLLEC